MKKFIALILVLVMVLSLSTVAFAGAGYEWGQSLAADTVNGVLSVFNRVSRVFGFKEPGYADFSFNPDNAYGRLANTVIDYHDGVVHGIAGAIGKMAESIDGESWLAARVSCCVRSMAGVFDYVYRICDVRK